jgi:hypothetical protein
VGKRGNPSATRLVRGGDGLEFAKIDGEGGGLEARLIIDNDYAQHLDEDSE